MVYHALGRQADSAAALDKLIRDHGEDSAFGVAEVYGYLGDADNAFEWLERAYRQKDPRTEYLKGGSLLGGIEHDPRHKPFLKKMNLPE